jgi:hypothetical protein
LHLFSVVIVVFWLSAWCPCLVVEAAAIISLVLVCMQRPRWHPSPPFHEAKIIEGVLFEYQFSKNKNGVRSSHYHSIGSTMSSERNDDDRKPGTCIVQVVQVAHAALFYEYKVQWWNST